MSNKIKCTVAMLTVVMVIAEVNLFADSSSLEDNAQAVTFHSQHMKVSLYEGRGETILKINGYPLSYEMKEDTGKRLVPEEKKITVLSEDRKEKRVRAVIGFKEAISEKRSDDWELVVDISMNKGLPFLSLKSKLTNLGFVANIRCQWELRGRNKFPNYFLPEDTSMPSQTEFREDYIYIGKPPYIWLYPSEGMDVGIGAISDSMVELHGYGKLVTFGQKSRAGYIFMEEGAVFSQRLLLFPARDISEAKAVYRKIRQN